MFGVLSQTPRQIDVLIETGSAEFPTKIVVEARYFSRKLDVKHVEAFLTKLKDVRAHVGVIVSPLGYTSGAEKLAKNNSQDVYLEIFTLAELKEWQGPTAIPYSRGNAVSIIAPLGWVVDGSKQDGSLARIYQRGLSQSEAIRRAEFMYINFWTKIEDVSNIPELLAYQWQYLKIAPNAVRVLLPGIQSRHETQIRLFSRSDHPEILEVTGLVDCGAFILMCVCIGAVAKERENIRRTRFVLESALPIKLQVLP
jgi:hypothetical protein